METPTIDFRYAPPLRWTCIGRPDDDYKTILRQDGSLQYGWNRVITFGLQYVHQPPKLQQHTGSPASAITVTTLDYGFASLTLTSFGHQHDGNLRTDVVLWKLTAAPTTPTLMGAVAVTIDERDFAADSRRLAETLHDLPSVAPAAPASGAAAEPAAKAAQPRVLIRSVPQRLIKSDDYHNVARLSLATDPLPLEGGATITGAFLLPQNHDQTDGMDEAWAQRALEAEGTFWRDFRVQPLELRVPDDGVQEMITACARNILQARVIKEGLPFFQVGPLVYRGLWAVDGYFITECARFLGHDQAADLAWDALLKFRREDGSIATFPHHTKETGIVLATFVRHSELTGNWDRLKKTWPIVRAAVAYIQRLRDEACALDPSHECHRLLPESYGDGGLGGQRPEYSTTLWTAVGLKEIARGARIIGQEKDAARFQKMYDELRADLLAHAERHRVKTATGTTYLPMTMLPDQHNFGLLHTDTAGTPRPWTLMGPAVGTWAYCQAIYPGELLPPDHHLVTDLIQLFDDLDDEEGIPKETGWIPWVGLWNYFASFAAHVNLYAGNADKAVQYLYAFANHAGPTRVWREEQSLQSHPQHRAVGDMPHNWASAEFIRLVRNLLVFEMGDELHLLRGLPSQWLVPNKPVVVQRTPTRFGRVSLTANVNEAGQVRLDLQRDSKWTVQPKRTVLWLPPGAAQVQIDGKSQPVDGRQVELPPAAQNTITFTHKA